jgi:hypothetical protein
MTIITQLDGDGRVIGRCDAKCHEAKTAKCHCICGGKLHGAALGGRLESRVTEMFPEVLAYAKAEAERAGGTIAFLDQQRPLFT